MKIALIGAGSRGFLLAGLCRKGGAQVIAVAEPRPKARAQFASEFGLEGGAVFESWQQMMKNPPACDAAIIATMDKEHRGPAEACMALGWDLLLEKPMAPSWEDCAAIEAAQRRSGVTLAVCHSLRYHQAFQRTREIAQSGQLGRLMTIDLFEQVGYWHFAHSFVRGNWRREDEAAFVLLAKSCHDMDYLSQLADRDCLSVASFGELSHFRAEHAPEGATPLCSDGCPVSDCAYDARKIYSPKTPGWGCVKNRAETLGESPEQAREAMLINSYGRCVYRCDNDVADHQSVLLEFEGGLVATFTLSAFTVDCARRIRVQGTEGELEMKEEAGGQRLTWKRFGNDAAQDIFMPADEGSHGGADARLVAAWLKSLAEGGASASSAQASLASHRIAFAAEESRKTGRTIVLQRR